MIKWLSIFMRVTISALRTRRDLAIENLLLRQQLAVYKNDRKRPRLTNADRAFWTIVASTWSQWRELTGNRWMSRSPTLRGVFVSYEVIRPDYFSSNTQ
jgi:hypothetical protein